MGGNVVRVFVGLSVGWLLLGWFMFVGLNTFLLCDFSVGAAVWVFAASVAAFATMSTVPIWVGRIVGGTAASPRYLLMTLGVWLSFLLAALIVAWQNRVLVMATWPALSAGVGIHLGFGLLEGSLHAGHTFKGTEHSAWFTRVELTLRWILTGMMIIAFVAALTAALVMLFVRRALVLDQ